MALKVWECKAKYFSSLVIQKLHFMTDGKRWKRCSCGSVVEHCVSSAKGCGFNSHGTHWQKMYNLSLVCKSLWIKVSAKCIKKWQQNLLYERRMCQCVSALSKKTVSRFALYSMNRYYLLTTLYNIKSWEYFKV